MCGACLKVKSTSCWSSQTCRSPGDATASTSPPRWSTRYHPHVSFTPQLLPPTPTDLVSGLSFTWCCVHCQQIVFEGIRGTAGFIGLDDIQYTVGVDCAKEVADVVPGTTSRSLSLFDQLTTEGLCPKPTLLSENCPKIPKFVLLAT